MVIILVCFFFFLLTHLCSGNLNFCIGSGKNGKLNICIFYNDSFFTRKKAENMFNFTIISNGFAAQCIHLKIVLVPGRASVLFFKQMFLGQHVGSDC